MTDKRRDRKGRVALPAWLLAGGGVVLLLLIALLARAILGRHGLGIGAVTPEPTRSDLTVATSTTPVPAVTRQPGAGLRTAVDTPVATNTARLPTETPAPGDTPQPPADTPTPTGTRPRAAQAPRPTQTPGPTQTDRPTNTPTPPLAPTPADRERIAFVSDRDGDEEIYVISADGSGLVQLTANTARDFSPAWSPDGTRLAFTSDRDGNDEIYIVNADGSGQVNLTDNPAEDYVPVWSPDGTRIAYWCRWTNTEICVVPVPGPQAQGNAGGSGLANLTNDPAEDYGPTWSPDGTRIAFYSGRGDNFEVYVMQTDGSGLTNVSNHPAFDQAPDWSPQGEQIVFYSRRDGNSEVYVVSAPGPQAQGNAGGTEPANLTQSPADDWGPVWSPDGTRIAFASDRDGFAQIYVMPAPGTQAQGNGDGSRPVRLTNGPAASAPAWSPDGTRIAFYAYHDGNAEIYVVNVDGSGLTNLTNSPGTDKDPVWSPR